MATQPTAEQSAREILAIFLSNSGCRSGEALPFGNVNVNWCARGLNAEDFDSGLEYAVIHKWIELIEKPHLALKITEEGFRQS